MLTIIQNRLRKLFVNNWRPKLICLAIAILLWSWVEYFYADPRNGDEWDEDDVRFTLPE